ncbi:unnamed protein product [Moneuplotes crassus]|uniref:Uncharacterized protein n=1 Tax=Euplotes crassus TaxID=5936 RepID=A0AAD2D988_EUPCR|nr:unnamed protein product [Moneuplotes crassus]
MTTAQKKKVQGRFEHEIVNLRKSCKKEKCDFASDSLISSCVDYCVNKDCFQQAASQLEFGEQDKFKNRRFIDCVKDKLREEAKQRGEL